MVPMVFPNTAEKVPLRRNMPSAAPSGAQSAGIQFADQWPWACVPALLEVGQDRGQGCGIRGSSAAHHLAESQTGPQSVLQVHRNRLPQKKSGPERNRQKSATPAGPSHGPRWMKVLSARSQ